MEPKSVEEHKENEDNLSLPNQQGLDTNNYSEMLEQSDMLCPEVLQNQV